MQLQDPCSIQWVVLHSWRYLFDSRTIPDLACAVCVLRRFTRVQLFVTPWTTAHQTPLAMEFSRQEYWNGLPFPFSGDFPNPGMEPESLLSPAAAGGFFTTSATYGSSFKVVLDTSPSVFSLSLLFVQQDIPDSF